MTRLPRFDRLDDRAPHVRVLANGAYTVMITGAGSGISSCRGQAITGWLPDRTEDGLGFYLYLRDLDDGACWSATHQPTDPLLPGRGADVERSAKSSAGRVGFECVARGVESRLELCVDPARDCEIRRLVLTNRSERERTIEVTSYAEIVLAPLAAHHGHPAFSKLFVQTEHEPGSGALLASRRPRGRGERRTWAAHRLIGDGPLELETDRARFVGRGRSLAAPQALVLRGALSGTVGNVLDPVFSFRRVARLAPGARACFDCLLSFGESRDDAHAAVSLAAGDVEPIFLAAEEREKALRRRLKIKDGEAERLQEIAGRLAYRDPDLRPASSSSDAARAYLEALGLAAAAFDLPPEASPKKGGRSRRTYRRLEASKEPARHAVEPLEFDNGYGGFSGDGREYVIRFDGSNGSAAARPPMPWINVVANETFGFFASESGAGTTWSGNSREHRLTPWWNDPIIDPHGEAIYVRDEKARTFWSALPGPIADGRRFEVRHGFGATVWRHSSAALEHEVVAFVTRDAPLKLVALRLANDGPRPRRLSIFAYQQLVLGVFPWETAPSIVTEIDQAAGAVLARNEAAGDFAGRVTFAAAVAPNAATIHATADRTGFLGRNRSSEGPAAVTRETTLDGRAGRGLDPCAALQIEIEVPAHGNAECAFLLGEEASTDEARRTIERFRQPGAVAAALDDVRAHWNDVVRVLEVKTPSAAIDLMLNGWLLYQCLACRLWGRTAFYQSGGAFGFRDQLQDSAALLYCRPDLTRAQILLHAAHQFVEGDVLHWWHPPADRGTRTRCSDDLLWLPYVTSLYVRSTGDFAVLDEPAGYVTARALEPGEDEAYLPSAPAAERSDVYEHCCRAIDRSLARGAHGLPLIGTCDWNDGMNHVGREGRGESIWLGFFLYTVLEDFLPICERRGDGARADRYRTHRAALGEALETSAWDGEWYRRAYYDDGAPLGSAENDECKIDVLAQAWAVISRAAPPERARRAMDAAERELVDREGKLIRLLTPPFDRTARDPGYIKGYLPGIRENGGQYTHAATWAVRAFAELGRRDLAATLCEMITPIVHAADRAAADVYKVEPYVVAADVYGASPHVGRGGWTWYTGSAGWLYRVALESILGVTLHDGTELRVKPCIPDDWPSFRVRYRLTDRKTIYEIEVENPQGKSESVKTVSIDGVAGSVEDGAARIALEQDGRSHRAVVTLG